ncbi:MAG TPA: ABC transporter substrate-binding protein [Bacillota bacterium]|nr:ABC transporter substrate-binding protein [Bacillota bacterium]
MMSFKRKASLLLVVALLVSVLATGCGGANSGQTGDKKDQLLYMASYCAPVIDWDPSICFSVESLVMANFYETLLRYDSETDSFTPVLATEYSKSDDGLTWTFKIREGVKFHDGSDMDASDVVYSLERSKNMNKGASFIWDPVDKITATDDHTVQIALKYAAPLDLIVSCAYSAYIMSPEQADQGTDWFQQGNECGTGPYMLQSQVPSDEVIMTKFDNYWGGWEGKHFDKVVIKNIGENASRRQMIESGEADITNSLMVEDLKALQKNPDVTIYQSNSFANTVGFFNTKSKPFDNKLVRQALNYAFPYDDVIEYVSQGFATRPTGPIPTAMWGSLDKPMYEHDMDKAKELLTEAGYPNGGFDMEITYISGVEDRKKTAELYKSELEKLGINVTITGMPWDQMWEKAKSTNPEDRQDWLSIAWWPDVVTPASWFKALYMTEDSITFNLGYYSNPELDKIIKDADVYCATDRKKAAELYQEAGKIVSDDAVSTFVTDGKSIYAIRNNLKNFSEDPAYPYVLFFYDFYRE